MPIMVIPANLNTKEQCLTVIQRYLKSVTQTDFKDPIKLSKNDYIWCCPCGCEITTEYGLNDIWALILTHLTTTKHDENITNKLNFHHYRIRRLDNHLSPSTIDQLEPLIRKHQSKYNLLSKWCWD